MRKLLLSFALFMSFLTPMYAVAGAVDVLPVCDSSNSSGTDASGTAVCSDVNAQKNSSDNPIIKILKAAIEVISFITGVAAVIMIIVSGIQFVVSSDSSGAARARNSLIYALIGVAITILAQAIVLFVLDKVN